MTIKSARTAVVRTVAAALIVMSSATVAVADPDGNPNDNAQNHTNFFGKDTENCNDVTFFSFPHWSPTFNPAVLNAILRELQCGKPVKVDAGNFR